jgi:glucan biosynthesis protein
MNRLSRAAFALAAVLAATAASAAGLDGKWQGTQGENTLTYIFKVDGEKLTGTIENSQIPGPIEIQDGKVKGNEISFNIKRDIQGTQIQANWTGMLAGDELKLTRTTAGGGGGGGAPGGAAGGPGGGGGSVEVVAKRVMEDKK